MVAEPRQSQSDHDEAVLIALVLLLLSGLSFAELGRRAMNLLATAGIAAGATAAVLSLIGAGGVVFTAIPEKVGPAESFIRRTTVTRRARYILAATKRLQAGGSPTAERALYRAHLAAEEKRAEAGRRVDEAAARFGPTLGWDSVRDSRTTRECAHAHGSNFSALVPPLIGWPGTLHGGNCRCRAVTPWPDGKTLA